MRSVMCSVLCRCRCRRGVGGSLLRPKDASVQDNGSNRWCPGVKSCLCDLDVASVRFRVFWRAIVSFQSSASAWSCASSIPGFVRKGALIVGETGE